MKGLSAKTALFMLLPVSTDNLNAKRKLATLRNPKLICLTWGTDLH